MKKILFVLILAAMSFSNAQFKQDLNKTMDVKSGILNKSNNSIFSFLGIEDFSMHHSFGLSYSTFGSNGFSLGTYTNSMFLKFSDRLNLMADISVVNSPYSSFGKDFSNQINGVYIDRIQMNYKISDDMSMSFQFSNSPNNYYSPFYYGGYSPFYRDSFFSRDQFRKE